MKIVKTEFLMLKSPEDEHRFVVLTANIIELPVEVGLAATTLKVLAEKYATECNRPTAQGFVDFVNMQHTQMRYAIINKISHEQGVQKAREKARDVNDYLAAEQLNPLYYLAQAEALVAELKKDHADLGYIEEKLRKLQDMVTIVKRVMKR